MTQFNLLVENSTCQARKRRSLSINYNSFASDDFVLENEDASFLIDDSDDDDDDEYKTIVALPFSKKGRTKRSIIGNVMSKQNATKHCKFALEESTTAKMCGKFVQSDIPNLMSSCISDLEVSM